MENIIIRNVTVQDSPALLEIYRPYVENTAISFELTPPSESEFSERILKISEKFPYLVLCENSIPVGYAYANTFHERSAYDSSVEISIYIKSSCRKKGYGRLLYKKLEDELKNRGFAVMFACIASSSRNPDENLTDASICFHEKMGFEHAGCFTNCAKKFGRWYNMVYMQKNLISDFCDDISAAQKNPDAKSFSAHGENVAPQFDSKKFAAVQNSKSEVCDIYDFQKRVTGKTFIRTNLIAESLGLCVHVCIFNDKKELLIQQRSETKKTAPGMWDFSVSGMVDSGESSSRGAERELKEELGITEKIDFPPIITKVFFNTFNDYYFIKRNLNPKELHLQNSEVQKVKWASRKEVLEMWNDKFLKYPQSLISLIFDVIESLDEF